MSRQRGIPPINKIRYRIKWAWSSGGGGGGDNDGGGDDEGDLHGTRRTPTRFFSNFYLYLITFYFTEIWCATHDAAKFPAKQIGHDRSKRTPPGPRHGYWQTVKKSTLCRLKCGHFDVGLTACVTSLIQLGVNSEILLVDRSSVELTN